MDTNLCRLDVSKVQASVINISYNGTTVESADLKVQFTTQNLGDLSFHISKLMKLNSSVTNIVVCTYTQQCASNEKPKSNEQQCIVIPLFRTPSTLEPSLKSEKAETFIVRLFGKNTTFKISVTMDNNKFSAPVVTTPLLDFTRFFEILFITRTMTNGLITKL